MCTIRNSWLRRLSFFMPAALLAVLLVASTQAAARPAPPAVQPTQDSQPVDNLEDVQKAVVRIEAVGTFKDPQEQGMLMFAGSGSGFIIDPEGHVVTNNHVVTGAAYFQVYLDGQKDPVSARVVGASECADLAVIDLEDDGYPFLAWYDQPIKVSLPVYAAGFPLGDPEYTLTNGIVSKARVSGESDWASVDKVFQHDANIDHGNSGGPLVTANGRVVGINYAGNTDSNQYHSISRDGAQPVIKQLLEGKDVDWIGINGQAILDEKNDFSGIFVASVASGSPADDIGILPGDVLLSLEGLPLAEDGTMATYCEILRSHDPSDVMNLEVLRTDSKEVLQGQLNGRSLQQSINLAEQVAETTDVTPSDQQTADNTNNNQSTGTQAASYTDYAPVNDAQGLITADVPVEWKDVEESDWNVNDETVGVKLTATPNLKDFADNWGIPGVVLSYSDSLPESMTVDELLDTYDYSDVCTDGGREDLPDGDLVGAYQVWKDCTDSKSSAVISVLTPADAKDYYAVMEIYIAGDADVDAMDHIVNSFRVGSETGDNTNATTTTDSSLLDQVDTAGLVYQYVEVKDPAIVALIPEDYSDIESAEWKNKDGENLGFMITAAPDIKQFSDTWSTPGLIMRSTLGLSEALDPDEVLKDDSLAKDCKYDKRYTDTHSMGDVDYTITYDRYTRCGGTKSSYIVGLAESDPLDQAIFFDFLIAGKADEEAFDVWLQSFVVDPTLAPATGDSGQDGDQNSDQGGDQTDGPTFTSITDDSGTITLNVPDTWTDVKSEDWDLGDGPIGQSITAAPDAKAFNDTWDTAGVFIGVSEDLAAAFTPDSVLDAFDFSDDCTYDDRYDYKSENLEGVYDVWTDCGDVTGETFVALAATPIGEESPIIFLYMNLPTEDDTAAFDEVVNTLAVAGSLESVTTSEEETLIQTPLAVVETNQLNIRSGPSTDYNRVGVVEQGDALEVVGQVNNCAWLQIKTTDGVAGWVSGSDRYVTLDTRCTDIPEVQPPAPPPASSGSNSGASSGSNAGAAQSGGASSAKGCFLFQNQLGAELTITFTRSDTGKGTTFKAPASGEVQQCFDPGKYTYTLDAPPPWGSTNGELTVEAGDNVLFPISPQ